MVGQTKHSRSDHQRPKAVPKGKKLKVGAKKTSKSKSVAKKTPAKKRAGKAPTVPKVAEAQEFPQKVRALGRYLKISPTKVRGLLDLIRGQSVSEARRLLRFSSRKGARLALKVLDSAVANAKDKGSFSEERWVVSDARADKGPLFRKKRDPKARGSWGLINTPSTHLKIVIGEGEANKAKQLAAKGQKKGADKKQG
jgi:large subunit ribosomal protein L22